MALTLKQIEIEQDGIILYDYVTVDDNNNIVNNIRCGDIITTDENGQIITVNGKPYVHTKG